MTQQEFNDMLAIALSMGLTGGYYTSRYSGEEIDAMLGGTAMVISGAYPTLADLEAAFPTGTTGTTGTYQAQDTRILYTWNAATGKWDELGRLQGPQGEQGLPGQSPIVQNGTWWVWNPAAQVYEDSGVAATGPRGDAGAAGKGAIIRNGTWWLWDADTQAFVDSGVAATGPRGDAGAAGKGAIIRNGTWWLWDADTQAFVDSGVTAQGPKGETGDPGKGAVIMDGVWWVWDADAQDYKNTGVSASVLFATFAVDPYTGNLIMTTPDQYTGPQFYLTDGYLEVAISA